VGEALVKIPDGVTGIIHGGAHLAEEMPEYIAAGVTHTFWVEPQARHVAEMRKRYGSAKHRFAECALGAATSSAHLLIASNSQSSSLLRPGAYLNEHHPSIVFPYQESVMVRRLDGLIGPDDRYLYQYLVLDVQGFELEALKGATETLKSLRYVRAEIATADVYEGCARFEELKTFMTAAGYELVEHFLWEGYAEGEALWRRRAA
jgi:FkbM family methyltransferase